MPVRADATDLRRAEDLTRAIFGIGEDFDVLLFQAEAIAAIEAAARAAALPGRGAATVLTSVYGGDIDAWFGAGGAPTTRLDLQGLDRAVTVEETAALLDRTPDAHVLGIVQGEALTGLVNPVDDVAALAMERGLVMVVDAVSSVGAEPFTPDRWGSAISIIGAQKALGGPAGLSTVVVERSLWEVIGANPSAPRHSFLSLLDMKRDWLDVGRAEYLGTPNSEEVMALLDALRVVEARGIAAVERQHQEAAAVARAAVRDIPGVEPTVAPAEASGIATTFRLLDGSPDRGRVLDGLRAVGVECIKTAPDPRTLRWMHYGDDATGERIQQAATALAAAVAGP